MSISYEVGPDRSVFAESENFVRLSDVILGREDGGGPERLFAILERSVPRHDDPSLLTQEELQRRREIVDQTWDQVRRWLWAHADKAVRAEAASLRGQGDVTALHLMCKLDNPPTEVIEGLVEAAPEVVSWVDAHGWLPLHYACVSGASTEVLRLLTSKFPESKLVQDNQGRTPLHFYVTRIADNPNVMATNVGILSDTGAAELPDCRGMLPMHYACAYGNHPAVLTVLENAYPEAIARKENNGRTPLHLTMSNAYRDASPGVLNFLLQHESHDSSNMRDNEGNSPLHLLKLGIKNQKNVEEFEKHMHNFAECLKLYLASSPELSPDFLASLQALPDWLQEVAVVSPHVRDILNEKIIQRFPTSILMLDGYMLICIIVCFEIATIQSIDKRFSNEFDEDPIAAWALLIVGSSYFLLREFIQVVALWSMGSLSSWFYDTTNWLDMTVIVLTFHYSILMITESPAVMSEGSFRAGCAFTKGVLWMAVIFFLKSTQVDFAVFLGGVFYVVQRLVAFLLAVGVILLAFAQMFFLAYLQEEVCSQENPDNSCEFPHCDFKYSLLKVWTLS
jgi:Ankyrin repeats (3 copies)